MSEKELLYYYPYLIDKLNNFRSYLSIHNSFENKLMPGFYGNHFEFLYNKTNFSDIEKSEIHYVILEFYYWQDWFTNGRNIFSFSKELLSLLNFTDVDNITPDQFKLPYMIFYLSLKSLNIQLPGDEKEIIEGVYIYNNIWNDNGEHPDGYFDLRLNFVGDFKKIFTKFSTNIKDTYDNFPTGNFWSINLNFEKEKGVDNIKQAVDNSINDLKTEIFPNQGIDIQITDYHLDFYNSYLKLIENTLKLVINCLLYLSLPKTEIDDELKLPSNLPSNFDKKLSFAKSKKEQDKIIKKINETGFSKIHFIGNTFKRNNTITNQVDFQISPHWRRGHWRNQPFGKSLSEKKLVWIRPTIVNAKLGNPEKGHIYI